MRYAHIEIGTPEDIADLFALLRSGATVGVTARAGHLYGPVQPVKLTVTAGEPTLPVTDLEGFLSAYLDDSRGRKTVSVPESSEATHIRAAWVLLNQSAGLPLSRLAILRLARIVADAVGTGTIELQHAYGDDGWIEFTKEGLGWLTLWHQPSERELHEIAEFGARGVVLASNMAKRFPWFERSGAGVAGPYPMPPLGLLDYADGDTPEAAVIASTAPSGLSGRWDRARAFLPLCGLLLDSAATEEAVRAAGWVAWCAARDRKLTHRALYVSKKPATVARAHAGQVLTERFSEWFRVDFTDVSPRG